MTWLRSIITRLKPSNTAAVGISYDHTDYYAPPLTVRDALIKYYKSWAAICAHYVARAAASRAWYAKRRSEGKDEPVQTSHPLARLLDGNATYSYQHTIGTATLSLALTGNAYMYVADDGTLIPLPPDSVTCVADDFGVVTKYILSLKNTQRSVLVKDRKIIRVAQHVMPPSVYGRGDLEIVTDALARLEDYNTAEKAINKNAPNLSVIVSYKGRYTKEEINDILAQWSAKYSSPRNAGKPLVTTGEVDVRPISVLPKDMMWLQGREWTRKEICAAFGVPLALIDGSDVSYATAKAAMDHFYAVAVFPKLTLIADAINRQHIIPTYGAQYYIWFDDRLEADKSDLIKSIVQYYQLGIIDRNEARQALGYDPLEEEAKQ